jgi:uncharacterized protein with von Willebrand factor type A (vWA) domain
LHLIAALAALALAFPAALRAEGTPLSDHQALHLYFADSGRSFGYQVMMARIQLDTIKAELARDEAILRQNEELHARNAVPLIDLRVSQLKDAWNRKQLIVAEKNLEFLSAEYAAMTRLSEHYAGKTATVEELYAIFRRGWDASCAKGPDEVAAFQAWAAYVEKSLERARQLNQRGSLSDSEVLQREAQLAIATSNYKNRLGGLDQCRAVLFPSLEEVLAPAP